MMKFIFMIGICFLSFLNKEWLIQANKEMMLFFFEQMLPSMFFLMVIIRLFLSLISFSKPSFFTLKALNINLTGGLILCSMILLGFPSGAILINEMVKRNQIQLLQAKRFIYCTSIASTSFMLISLSLFFHSEAFALSLYLIQLLTILILLFFTRSTPLILTYPQSSLSFFKALNQAIHFAFSSLSFILAYLLIIASIKTLCLLYLPFLQSFIPLILEFSSALHLLSQTPLPLHLQFIFANALISFGGLAVHLQIMGSCEESQLNYLTYFGYRMIQVLCSILLSWILLPFLSF